MRYEIRHAMVAYAANTILKDVNFEIHDTEKIAIVGRNGCGKTTLLKLISGEIKMNNLDSDEECGIFLAGTQQIGYLRQISFEDKEISVREEIMKVFEPVFACERRMQELTEKMAVAAEETVYHEYAALQAKMDSLNGYTWRTDMESMFQQFGFALEDLDRPIGTFSGGQQTKVAFIKLLLSRPDIMLLDEPTNHLDITTIEWLEGYLKNYNKAVVIVSHDRMFLDRIIDVTYEIEYHKIKRYPGNYTAFLKQKEEAAVKQEKDYEEQQKEIKRLTEWIEKWKNTPTKVAATRSKRKVIEHMELIPKPVRFDTKAFHGQFEPRTVSYTDVLLARGLQIGYDHILSRVSFDLHRGERMAVIGQNGKGKSTLLKTLVGMLAPLGGTFSMGTGVDWGYFDQQAAVETAVDPKQTVMDNFWDRYPQLKEVEVRNALGSFLFSQEDVFKELGQLSGGEKVRLALCKMFKERPNLLILDEPTNHMDMVGKQALEAMLKDYTGTILFVSHDRYFVKEIATDILEFGEDRVDYYDCGYEEYLERKEKLQLREAQKETAKETAKQTEKQTAYYNPGKQESRLKQKLVRCEKLLAESEARMEELQKQQSDPAIASDFKKLTELAEGIQKEEAEQETLLEQMMEIEEALAK